MAYEIQTWVDGESPLNAERMNHIESGIAIGSTPIFTIDVNNYVDTATESSAVTANLEAKDLIGRIVCFNETIGKRYDIINMAEEQETFGNNTSVIYLSPWGRDFYYYPEAGIVSPKMLRDPANGDFTTVTVSYGDA